MAKEYPSSDNLHAVLIGIDCYLASKAGTTDSMNLTGCVRDIDRVEKFLLNEIGLPQSRILKLTATDTGGATPAEPTAQWPTRENIISAFRWLDRVAGPGHNVYIHYSGHGARVKTPQRFRHLKPTDSFDEALVPCDYSSEQDRLLRDFELANILQGYARRKLGITIVLDSCHSGGATRSQKLPAGALRTTVRSIGTITDFLPPPEVAVATDDQLAATLKSMSRPASRDFDVSNGGFLEPYGYALLAACRPSEFAYEHPFNGSETSGVLTYWLLDSLKVLGPGVSLKILYDRILAKVHSQFNNQTPQLQGEVGRAAFGKAGADSRHTVTVLKVINAEDELVLNVGQAAGVTTGARFTIYPAGENGFKSDRKRALVSITTLGATSSQAAIIKRFSKQPIEQGDLACLEETGASQLVRTIRLLPRNGASTSEERALLQGVENALKQRDSFLQIAADGLRADFAVSLNDNNEYVVSDSTDREIPHLFSGSRADRSGAANLLVERLTHLAKYLNVNELENFDPHSPLRLKLSAKLLGVQAEYLTGGRAAPQPFPEQPGGPEVKTGEWVFVRIRNDSSQVLNITTLDLRPNWSIRQIYPAGAAFYEPLDPGHSLTLPLRAALPDGYDRGKDLIKVMATTGPSNFRWLELPEINDSQERVVWRCEPGTKLEEFLKAFMQDGHSLRDFNSEGAASHEWTSTQIEIHIRKV